MLGSIVSNTLGMSSFYPDEEEQARFKPIASACLVEQGIAAVCAFVAHSAEIDSGNLYPVFSRYYHHLGSSDTLTTCTVH